jgi:hypothetical protein
MHGLADAARAALASHGHFRGRADQFTLTVKQKMVVVHGVVPSFYLKQMLQVALSKVKGVERVANHVVVVNSQGLSSEPGGANARDRSAEGRASHVHSS